MSRHVLFSFAILLGVVNANAQIVDVRNLEEFEAKRAEKIRAEGVARVKIDQLKFDAAVQRREDREGAAREAARSRRASAPRVFPIGASIPVAANLRPMQVPNIPVPVGGGGRGFGVFGVSIPVVGGANVGVGVGPALLPGPAPQAANLTTVLFLPGTAQSATSPKIEALRSNGMQVVVIDLPPNDFAMSVALAETALAQFSPDVIVGDSRGGAVAMNMESGETPLVLLAPDYRQYGRADTVKEETTILHAPDDRAVRFRDSERLLSKSGLPASHLIAVGKDHRLADGPALQALVARCLTF